MRGKLENIREKINWLKSSAISWKIDFEVGDMFKPAYCGCQTELPPGFELLGVVFYLTYFCYDSNNVSINFIPGIRWTRSNRRSFSNW